MTSDADTASNDSKNAAATFYGSYIQQAMEFFASESYGNKMIGVGLLIAADLNYRVITGEESGSTAGALILSDNHDPEELARACIADMAVLTPIMREVNEQVPDEEG